MKKYTIFVLVVLFLSVGCATCPPCVPETIEVSVPVVSCPPPVKLPEILLPNKPILPENATQDEVKNYYADVVEYIRVRDSLKDSRIDLLEELLDVYREMDGQ